jgi:outer membrane protein
VRRLPRGVAALAVALAATGCASTFGGRTVDSRVSPSPAAPWQPPPEGRMPAPPPRPPADIPPEYLTPGALVSLDQVIDVALRANPATRTAWAQARAAAAVLGSRRSEYFPEIDLNASYSRQKATTFGGQSVFFQTTYGPSLSLSWLLFNFGGVQADVAEARAALFSADWTHNAVIQNLVLQVEVAYYAYQNAKAQAAAAETALAQARESLAAAEERHRAGVATIADVLQARTALSQAELVLETAQGQIQTLRGALATAAGVSPGIAVDVQPLPDDVNVNEAGEAVDRLIERAQAQRPDLAAARFEAERARSHVTSVRAQGLPALSASGSAGRLYFYNGPGFPFANTYSGAILFRFPVFTGGRNVYDELQAREQAKAAESQAQTVHDQVVLQVWTSYFNLKTAAQRVKTARDLLASATQSQEVALGRYRAGLGSILDLLTAQSAYASARAQEAQARADWLVAMAQLAHDTGALGPPVGVAVSSRSEAGP